MSANGSTPRVSDLIGHYYNQLAAAQDCLEEYADSLTRSQLPLVEFAIAALDVEWGALDASLIDLREAVSPEVWRTLWHHPTLRMLRYDLRQLLAGTRQLLQRQAQDYPGLRSVLRKLDARLSVEPLGRDDEAARGRRSVIVQLPSSVSTNDATSEPTTTRRRARCVRAMRPRRGSQ